MNTEEAFFDFRETPQIPTLETLLKKSTTLLFLWPIENKIPNATLFLSTQEQNKLKTLSSPQRQQQYLASRYYSKILLAKHFHVPPSLFDFEIRNEGKLALPSQFASSKIDFNFSHTETLFLMGLSTSHWIGVDVEAETKRANQTQIAERLFSDSERKWIEAADGAHKTERFFRLWSLKEAVIKAAGGGVFKHVQEIKFHAHEEDLRLHNLPDDFGLLSDWQTFENQNIQGFSCAWALKARHS